MSVGRPTKKTPAVEKKILDALRDGNTRSASAALAGLGKTAFYAWFNELESFSNAVQKAEAEAEAVRVARIRKAGDEGNWQADAWWLERRRHEAYGRKDPLEKMFARMSADELREYIARHYPGLGTRAANGAGAPMRARTGDDEPE